MSGLEKLRLRCFDLMTGLGRRGYLNFIPDRPYLKVQYYLKLGRRLNLRRPELYNEKLQWIKLYDRKPLYSRLADKLAVREYVGEKGCGGYLIPQIAACDAPGEINWDALPDRFVIKCTHGSSSNIICADKSRLDRAKAIAKLEGWMNRSWYWMSREWPYKDIPPRILIEEFIGDEAGNAPYDYKFLCFDGEPAYVIVDADRYTRHTRTLYSPDWVRQDVFNRHPNIPREIPRPKNLDVMLDTARKLSGGIPHVRVDLYETAGRVYFGEMTFFHGYGMEVFRPRSFEQRLGSLIPLPGAQSPK
jgi:hypothetical protein